VTSIAVQLASHVPGVRQHVCEAVTKFPNISSLSLRDQWRHLVVQPLSALGEAGNTTSVVLVIDALDECDDNNNIGRIVKLLVEARDLSGLRLRIFLTSRFETAIRHGFNRVSNALLRRYVLHRISPDIVDADIALFLEQNLMAIGQQQYLAADWLSPEIVATITRKAHGLFIWAATAYRFIQQGRRFAAQRLESIMKQDGDSPVGPEVHLDNLYLTVLRDSLCPEYSVEEKEEHCKMLRVVLGTLVVLESPLSMQALGELLTVEKQAGGIESIIQDLHAILDIPEDETGALRLHHPSLRDFLLHRHRCTDLNFFVEAIEAHRLLTCQIQDLMIRYFEQDEWKNRTAISKLRDKVYNKRRCPLGMEYACRNWIRHLKRSGFNIPPKDGNARSFLDEHAINWAIMLTRWDDDPERIGHIYDLEQRFSVSFAFLRSRLKRSMDPDGY